MGYEKVTSKQGRTDKHLTKDEQQFIAQIKYQDRENLIITLDLDGKKTVASRPNPA